MATSTSENTAPELERYLRSPDFGDLFSTLSSSPVIPSLFTPAALASADHTNPQCQPRSTSLSSSLNVLYNPSPRPQSALSKELTFYSHNNANLGPTPTPPRTVLTAEANPTTDITCITPQAPADPKTFEILFVYDDMTKLNALCCNPSSALGQQFIISGSDLCVSSVEWRVREESKQHFLIIDFDTAEQSNRRVFLFVEGDIPEKDTKEGADLLSEYGRPLKRLDWQLNKGKQNVEEVEMKDLSFTPRNTKMYPGMHRFIRKVTIFPPSFSLLQLAILTDVAVRYCPSYSDLPPLSLWLATIIYSLIKEKTPIENMLESLADGCGRLIRNFRCCSYEHSLLRPNSKKQLPYYLRKFDKAMTKYTEEVERKENGVGLASYSPVQLFGLLKSPMTVEK